MNDRFVPVISMSNCTVILTLPEYHYERIWPRKGARLMIDKEILSNSIYNPGVERLFTEGLLYIDDKQLRIDFGFEQEEVEGEEGALPARSIIVLDDKMMNRIVKLMPMADIQEIVPKLTNTQKLELVDYAVAHYIDLKMDRVEYLSKECGISILQAVEMKKAMEEE